MQCGPLASRETTATSQGRARYAAATHPHGSPSSASSSKMVPVGRTVLTVLTVAAWTAILTSRRQPPVRLVSPVPSAIPGPAIPLDCLSARLVPYCREIPVRQAVSRHAPGFRVFHRMTPEGDNFRRYPILAELSAARPFSPGAQ